MTPPRKPPQTVAVRSVVSAIRKEYCAVLKLHSAETNRVQATNLAFRLAGLGDALILVREVASRAGKKGTSRGK